ncbi:MAG: hypothetical protein P8163_22500 [Candidatus Thiodiazotropha sp.]
MSAYSNRLQADHDDSNLAAEQQRWCDTEVALDSVQQGRVVAGKVVHEWLDGWGSEAEIASPKT